MSDELDGTSAVDARIAWVLDHAGTSQWLKHALRSALQSDPVSVSNEVEVLRQLLQSRADAWASNQFEPDEPASVSSTSCGLAPGFIASSTHNRM